jgi:hypothetical protein
LCGDNLKNVFIKAIRRRRMAFLFGTDGLKIISLTRPIFHLWDELF